MARRTVGLIRRLIAALVAFVLSWEIPRIWNHEPFDHTHLEDASLIHDNRPQVEQAPPPIIASPPPSFVSSQVAWHPSYYTPDASVVWHAVEQQKKKIAAIAA